MIRGEFLCDHQDLSAFTSRERWPIPSGMSQKPYLGLKPSYLWLYGTAKAVPYVPIFLTFGGLKTGRVVPT
jgi:hypothetical protein